MKQRYVKEVPPRKMKGAYCKWAAILDEFEKSDERILELTANEDEYKRSSYLAASAKAAIKRWKKNMKCIQRGWTLYIIKTI